VADFLVVEEEVDKLGDLKVIDCDRWLVLGGNDEVLLFRPRAELHAPRGNAVDVALDEK
jgi:hypothetical protein